MILNQEIKSDKEKKKINQQKDGDQGVDNEAFSMSDGSPTKSEPDVKINIDGPKKPFNRRRSIVEKMLPEYQRNATRRDSTSAEDGRDARTSSGIAEVENSEEEVKTIAELVDAVQDLIDNDLKDDEDGEEERANDVKNDKAEAKIDMQLGKVNNIDATVHM